MAIDEKLTAVAVTFPSGQGGGYHLTLDYPGDVSMLLDGPKARRYAQAVLTAVAQAKHDASVLWQAQHQLGFVPGDAAFVVRQLRQARPALDAEALGVLRLEPAVSAPWGTPFLQCSTVHGGATWTWELGHAIDHATLVLLCCPFADLTLDYWRYLVGRMGMADDQAHCAVADLTRWRHRTAGTPSC